jgi:hypothetical protein
MVIIILIKLGATITSFLTPNLSFPSLRSRLRWLQLLQKYAICEQNWQARAMNLLLFASSFLLLSMTVLRKL